MKYKSGGAINQHKKMAMGMSCGGESMSKGGKISKMACGGSVSTKGNGCAIKKKPCKIC